MEEVRILITELVQLDDDPAPEFTSVIYRASMTHSWKNIKVSPYLTATHIRPLLLTLRLPDVPAITVLRDGHLVSRAADFIMYSVEAEFIDNVVAQYGPCKLLAYRQTPANASSHSRSHETRCNRFWSDIRESS